MGHIRVHSMMREARPLCGTRLLYALIRSNVPRATLGQAHRRVDDAPDASRSLPGTTRPHAALFRFESRNAYLSYTRARLRQDFKMQAYRRS